MKSISVTKEQAQAISKRFNDELDKMFMSWDDDLKAWHPIAIASLAHASAKNLNIPEETFSRLFETEKQGLNMNIVMVLHNSIEDRTPAQMGYDPKDWADFVLQLNRKIAIQWSVLSDPINQKLFREVEIMNNKPVLSKIIGQA